ncbi:segregation/condensation protein A (plasmid) [Clostridium perfringens]
MFESTVKMYEENNLDIKTVFISKLIDEFINLYNSDQLSPSEQIDCLDFINTLFRVKHRFLLEYNKEKRSFKRDTQMLHLRKIQRLAKLRIKSIVKTSSTKSKYEPSENVLEFRSLLKALNKKMKKELSDKTKNLLEELKKERWSIREKTNLLKSLLDSKDAKFQDLLESQDVEELITSFLALLDMKRNNEVKVVQKKNFGEITISKMQ